MEGEGDLLIETLSGRDNRKIEKIAVLTALDRVAEFLRRQILWLAPHET
jgi:hypothetical protein